MQDARPPLAAAERLALLQEAVGLIECQRFAGAAAVCAALLAYDPLDVEGCYLSGLARGADGHADEAARLMAHVRVSRPGIAHPALELAASLADRTGANSALRQLRASLAAAPADMVVRHALANRLLDAGDAHEAADVLAPLDDDATTVVQRGIALHDAGQMDAAIVCFRSAASLAPGAAEPWINLGLVLKVEGRFDEAIRAYDEAAIRAPGDFRVRINRAVALLRSGRMAEAWPDWEPETLAAPGLAVFSPATRLPPVGKDRLDGLTIIAWHEAGFGDTLQFARYLPMLADRGARVLLQAPPPLERLLARLEGVSGLLRDGEAIPNFDFHTPMAHLPRTFATTLATIPAATPYLSVPEALADQWRKRLSPAAGFRVGVAWEGQARPWMAGFGALNQRRNLHPSHLAPLARIDGIQFVSLQARPEIGASDSLPGLLDLMPDVTDFADTAAIVASLDLVVSVDTSVAHLAGALGVPVFLLDRYDSCWRWFSGRDDSPWYPSMRILRQARPGDWEGVVARAAEAVASLVRRNAGFPCRAA